MNLHPRGNFCWRLLAGLIIGTSFTTIGFAAGAQESLKTSQAPADSALWKQTRIQHQKLPTQDIWWTVNGKDMLWNFKNLHQLFPTANVYRTGTPSKLEIDLDPRLRDYQLEIDGSEMTLDQFINSDRSTVMGMVVLHKGKIAFESYPRMRDYEMPIHWSVAKVFPGLLVRILEERGQIDVSKPIDFYLQELSGSSFAQVTVRNLLDMASGLDCGDQYVTRDSCYYQYSISVGDGHWREGDPKDPYTFLAALQAERLSPQGERYSYSGVNTFILSWLVEKVTGLNFQDALSQEVWSKIGAEANASFLAPNQGVAMTHGGFLSRLRDLARFGALYTPSFELVADTAVISQAHLDLLQDHGRPELTADTRQMPGFKHNVYQWDAVLEDGTMFKGGWAGQGLIVNPRWDVVAVYNGYFKDDNYSEEPLMPHILSALKTLYGNESAAVEQR